MEFQSQFDPSRQNVGAIYLDAQKTGEKHVTVGDMTNELMSSLVEDLNNAITSNPFEGKPFYITIHEKKDLQMKNAIHRRMYTTLYRPYPEDDTVVFWVDPVTYDTRFCWCLPHHTDMPNILNAVDLYHKDMVADVKAWKNMDLYHFGFVKDEIGKWMANPSWEDKPLKQNYGSQVRIGIDF